MKPMIMRFQRICSKPHQGGGMCGEAQTSKKNSNFSSLGEWAGKKSKMFLAGTSLVLPKCTNFSKGGAVAEWSKALHL